MKRMKPFLLMLAGLALVLISGRQHSSLVAQREAYLPPGANALEDDDPMVQVVTVALGGFRGILADVLWIRLARLQEEGRYFELMQLADWITRLEPRIPEVWAYHAWNLTYNISVVFNTPEERWRWVRNGITLLRDDGLVANPFSPDLHWELGWFFQHKIGMDLDQMHRYYKEQWALEMMQLFEGPRPDYAVLNQVPTSREVLLQDPEVAELVQAFKDEGLDIFGQRKAPRERSLERIQTLIDTHPAAERLRLFLNRRALEDVYKLNLAAMQEIDAEFGPFDWRLPEAHAAYWAYMGRKHAEGFDLTRLDRMLYHNMADAFRRGKLTLVENLGEPVYSPNFDMLDNALRVYDEVLAAHQDESTMRTAHRYFLVDAVLFTYLYMQEKSSREVFKKLKATYPDEVGDRDYLEFVIYKMRREDMEALTTAEATSGIEGALYQSMIQDELGNTKAAERFRDYARMTFDQFMSNKQKGEFKDRMGLDFPTLVNMARERFKQTLEANRKMREEALAPPSESSAP